MILYHWQGNAPNFGDELNTRLWPGLLPGFFDGEPATRLLGIGSILDSRHPPQAIKIVAGAGYAGYERKPLLDESWILHWVRGPLTAAALGLPPALGLGDPAMLLPFAGPCPAARPVTVGFMPHFESLPRGPWTRVAALAGVTLIDPRDPPDAVIAAIAGCRLLLSESLHGAIVADTLRVPWIPLRPLAAIHRDKWHDWAASLDLCLRPEHLPATCGAEWLTVRGVCRHGRLRRLVARHRASLNGFWPNRFLDMAAEALRQAAVAEPHMSSDHALDRGQSRMLDAVARLRRDPMRAWAGAATSLAARPSPSARRRGQAPETTLESVPDSAPGTATGLHRPNKSEYELWPVG